MTSDLSTLRPEAIAVVEYLDREFEHARRLMSGPAILLYPDRWQIIRAELLRLADENATAEDALLRHGYRKSCDIPACNCGDRWNHGGHAADRLHEISAALDEHVGVNEGTVLTRVNKLASALAAARGELEALRRAYTVALTDCPPVPVFYDDTSRAWAGGWQCATDRMREAERRVAAELSGRAGEKGNG